MELGVTAYAYAYYFKKITIVGARLPRPTGWETPTPTSYITAPCGLTNPQVLGFWLGYVYPSRAVIVRVGRPNPYEVVLEKPSFQEKTRFRFVGVYTKNSCWLPQRVRHPTARSNHLVGEASLPRLSGKGFPSHKLGYFRMTILRVPEKSPASR